MSYLDSLALILTNVNYSQNQNNISVIQLNHSFNFKYKMGTNISTGKMMNMCNLLKNGDIQSFNLWFKCEKKVKLYAANFKESQLQRKNI